MNTAPAEMANKVWLKSPMSNDGSPPAVLKNTKYVGALSKKLDRIPVAQKYIQLIGPASFETELMIIPNDPLVPDFKIAIAGIMVTKIPANNLATSIIGNEVYSLAFRI